MGMKKGDRKSSSTSRPVGYWEDIQKLVKRANQGKSCCGTSLRLAGECWLRLYERRRSRPGWLIVVRDTIEFDDSPDMLLFFKRIPLPVFLVAIEKNWSMWHLLGKKSLSRQENDEVLHLIMGAYLRSNKGDARCFAPSRMIKDSVGKKIYSNVNELFRTKKTSYTYQSLVEKVSGNQYESLVNPRSGAKIWPAIEHTHELADQSSTVPKLVRLQPHVRLQSASEVVVDGVLAHHFGDAWPAMHRHSVLLSDIAPGDHGIRSVDIELFQEGKRCGVVEIGSGGALQNTKYEASRAYKRRVLRVAQVPLHECDLRGNKTTTKALRACIEWVSNLLSIPIQIDAEFIDTVWSHQELRVKEYASVDEHKSWIRQHSIMTHKEYEQVMSKERKSGNLTSFLLVPQGSLQAWMRRHRINWYELIGKNPTGKGSAKARKQSLSFLIYENYLDAKTAAQKHQFRSAKDYKLHRNSDPRLPSVDQQA